MFTEYLRFTEFTICQLCFQGHRGASLCAKSFAHLTFLAFDSLLLILVIDSTCKYSKRACLPDGSTFIVLARLCIEIKLCYCCQNQICGFLTEAKRNCFKQNCKNIQNVLSFQSSRAEWRFRGDP